MVRSVNSAPFSNQAISSALLISRAVCMTSSASSNVASGISGDEVALMLRRHRGAADVAHAGKPDAARAEAEVD